MGQLNPNTVIERGWYRDKGKSWLRRWVSGGMYAKESPQNLPNLYDGWLKQGLVDLPGAVEATRTLDRIPTDEEVELFTCKLLLEGKIWQP